jgi:GntR family transcriptional regulator
MELMIQANTERKMKEAGPGFFSLDPASGIPVYRQVIRQIEDGILAERFLPGDRLPTIRSLAVELKANPNTIAKAYSELEIRKIVNTQVGSGTYISNVRPEPQEDPREKKIRMSIERFLGEMADMGLDLSNVIDRLYQKRSSI